MAKMSNAALKRDLTLEAEILLRSTGSLTVGLIDLDKLVEAVEYLYEAFPQLKVQPGHFAPNQRDTWPY